VFSSPRWYLVEITPIVDAGEVAIHLDEPAGSAPAVREPGGCYVTALKATHAEILAQRTRIGELLGRIRDLEAEWTQDAVQRITSENATLKQHVRQLTTDNRTLDERLKAARSNPRFQDRRIADLEAQLADPRTVS
jgi:chromosome segregation ATPase